MVNNKLKRFLSLALICVMVTPMVSFATTDDTSSDTTTDNTQQETEIDTSDTVAPEKTEAERKAEALANAVVAQKQESINGHDFVTASNEYELYLKKDNLSILLRNIKTGAILESTITQETADERGYSNQITPYLTSGFAVKTLSSESKTRFSAAKEMAWIGAKDAVLDYTTIDNGFKCHFSYETYGIEFDINITLDNEGLHVDVPESGKKENNEKYYIGEVYLFPLLGYTDLGDRDGYMFLPDGNGITVNFENFWNAESPKYASGYVQRIYGYDISYDLTTESGDVNAVNNVTIPVFGMVHTDTKQAVLGIIEDGDMNTFVEGHLNGVSNLYENFACARYVYRALMNEATGAASDLDSRIKVIPPDSYLDDIKVTYVLTSGDEATYAGLANKYRQLLLDRKELTKEDDGFKMRVDFLGSDKEDFLVFKRSVTMTTVDNIREILGVLKDNGISDVLAVYNGWQDGGVYATPVDKFDVDSSVGGNKDLVKLCDELKDSSVDFYLAQDEQTINTSMFSSTFNTINTTDTKEYVANKKWLEVFHKFKIATPAKSDEYVKNLASDLKDEGIYNMAISGITNKIFSYVKNSTHYTRATTAESYINTISDLLNDDMKLALESPYEFLWKYSKSYLSVPLSSSMFVYTSNEVPFLTSVLKGSLPMYSEYVNFEANREEFYLKMIETGVYPSFYLTYESPSALQYTNSNWIYASEYTHFTEEMAEYYSTMKSVNDKTKDAYIINHVKLDSDVTITTYDNGVAVYVNHSKKDVEVDGLTIGALSYKVGEAK